MTIYVATFTYGASPQQMAALRPDRYAYFAELESRGVLLASGQLLDGDLGEGMLLLHADSRAAAADVLRDDPFAREGYVATLHLAAWNPTTGSWIKG